MELKHIVLIGGKDFVLGENLVKKIFMFNNETPLTLVTLYNNTILEETIVQIPYHSVLYYI